MNFFQLVYTYLRNIYNKIGQSYAIIITQHPFAIMLSYLIVFASFSFGLLQIEFIRDTESLTSVKNSQIQSEIKIIEDHFKEDPYNNYYQHHLLDFGYYVEVIISLKSLKNFKTAQIVNNNLALHECNILNKTYLNEYNLFFDSIISLSIKYDDFNQSKNVTYYDLCPKRTSKCAVEGGILRSELFKKKLFNNQIGYARDDPTRIFIDSEIIDGRYFNKFVRFRLMKTSKLEHFGNFHISLINRISNIIDKCSKSYDI